MVKNLFLVALIAILSTESIVLGSKVSQLDAYASKKEPEVGLVWVESSKASIPAPSTGVKDMSTELMLAKLNSDNMDIVQMMGIEKAGGDGMIMKVDSGDIADLNAAAGHEKYMLVKKKPKHKKIKMEVYEPKMKYKKIKMKVPVKVMKKKKVKGYMVKKEHHHHYD